MLARYYEARLGRFLSPDPGDDTDVTDPQSWNRFIYVRNNPLWRIDPSGRSGLDGGSIAMEHEMAKGTWGRTSFPTATLVVTVGVTGMGGLTGGGLSGGIAVDTQGNVALVGTDTYRQGLGLEAAAEVNVSLQPGTVQDLAGSGSALNASFELGEGGSGSLSLDDQGQVSGGIAVGYSVGVGASLTQDLGGTGLVMLNGDAPPPTNVEEKPRETVITTPPEDERSKK